MPGYSGWAREISEGSEERRVDKLEGIIEGLKSCVGDRDNENGPHVLLVKEAAEFVAALVSLACDSSAVGKTSTRVLFRLAMPEINWLPLLQFPGLLDALIANPHESDALAVLSWLSQVKDEAQQVAMATNTALVDLLVANVSRFRGARMVLSNLCRLDNNAVLLYEHPGLIAAVTDATRVPACASSAVGVLSNMARSVSIKMPMLRNPLVLDALLRAAGSDIDEVSERAIICLSGLSLKSENRELMRDDVRIMNALTARMDHAASKKALFIICYIGDLPNSFPSLDLSLFCSRPFHHQLSLVKALIREHPEQLSTPDASGHTPLTLAQAAPLPAHIIGLLSDCVTVSTLPDFSLAHLVGYTRSGIALARSQRYALMGSLAWLADKPAQPAEEDSPGALNAGKALKFYLNRGKDPYSIIALFAF